MKLLYKIEYLAGPETRHDELKDNKLLPGVPKKMFL